MGYGPKGASRFSLHGKESCTRTLVIAAIASSRECVASLHKGSRDASSPLGLFSSARFPSDTRIINDKRSFHEFSVACIRV